MMLPISYRSSLYVVVAAVSSGGYLTSSSSGGGRWTAGGKISEMAKWREGKQKWKMAGTKVAGIGGSKVDLRYLASQAK